MSGADLRALALAAKAEAEAFRARGWDWRGGIVPEGGQSAQRDFIDACSPDVVGLLLDAYERRLAERGHKLGGAWYELDAECASIRDAIDAEVALVRTAAEALAASAYVGGHYSGVSPSALCRLREALGMDPL